MPALAAGPPCQSCSAALAAAGGSADGSARRAFLTII
jgi:hypothetical protein